MSGDVRRVLELCRKAAEAVAAVDSQAGQLPHTADGAAAEAAAPKEQVRLPAASV